MVSARTGLSIACGRAGVFGRKPDPGMTLRAVLVVGVLSVLLATCSRQADPSQATDGTAPPTPPLAAGPPSVHTPTAPVAASPAVVPMPTPPPTVRPATVRTPTPAPTVRPAAAPTPAPVPAALAEMALEPAFPGLSIRRMVHLTYPDDGTNRLFVVVQPGRVFTFESDRNVSSVETFLDIRDRVNDQGNEEGLLGMAFDPNYSSNGYFYVYYSAARPRRSIISRFSVSDEDPDRADPTSEHVILEVTQPYSNHNGGQLLFGPDGYLYVGLGDGGSRADPRGNGQNASTLLGSILRIDVRSVAPGGTYSVPPDNPFVGQGEGAREEVWAFGLRNPWRFTFDRATGEMWAGDVGQDRYEEVDLIRPGRNYGWNLMEGAHCFQAGSCDREGLEMPVTEYDHGSGCSITGGYVYRGSRLPSLYGAYVYADYCSGRIWALRYDGSEVTEHLQILDSSLSIPSFGEDPAGELYVLAFDGTIYRFVAGD